jgi:DNA-binding transcriptional LysR family regulator
VVVSRDRDLKGHSESFTFSPCPLRLFLQTRSRRGHAWRSASFRSNDGEEQRAAVLAGLGITQAPHWLFAADIRAGTVRRILRDCEPARIPISAVRPASRRQPSKVAVFVDFLAELLAETDD